MNTHIASNQQTMTNLEPIRFDAPGTEPIMEVVADWTKGLPIFKGKCMMLRELVKSDATTLLTMLASEEVAKFISPPPTTPEGFEKFIAWAIRGREAGNQMMFGIVPEGFDHAVGLVQIRAIAPRFSVAEWGFAVGSPFWGTGIFLAGARMALDFAFQQTAVNRLEARAVVHNGRGNGSLRKLEIKAGDKVLFSKYSGNEIKIDGTEHLILREDDVLAVIE